MEIILLWIIYQLNAPWYAYVICIAIFALYVVKLSKVSIQVEELKRENELLRKEAGYERLAKRKKKKETPCITDTNGILRCPFDFELCGSEMGLEPCIELCGKER